MSTHSHVSSKWTAVLAILFLLPSLIFFVMWSSVGLQSGISEGEEIDTYMSYFPGWVRNINMIHAVSIACCIIAITLAARSFRKRLLSVRVLMLVTVLVSIFILLFDLIQMI